MNNSLRIIRISLVLWFGLSIGLANAATSIATPLDDKTEATAKNSSGLAVFNINDTAVYFRESTGTAEPIPAEAASIRESSSMRKATGHAVDAESNTQISAYQSYAMLLVGLGMLFFSARQRTNAI